MKHLTPVILILLIAFCVVQGQAQTNLAFGKTATQSSTYMGNQGSASKAIDDNTDGRYFSGSVTHTAEGPGGGTANPWWQVDLGDVYTVYQIQIWNRTDCCAERLNNFKILVRRSTSESWQEFVPGLHPYRYSGTSSINFNSNKQARFVLIQLENPSGILSLAEVRVIGGRAESNNNSGAGLTNFAYRKFATQSSDYENGVASKAVDGNTDGHWGSNSVTHTGNASNPWWQVDLGATYNVNQIQIWNRTDCCSERLNNLKVLVKSSPGAAWEWFVPGLQRYNPNQRYPLIFSGNKQVRYVMIQLELTGFLSLAEVKVLGYPNNNSSGCITPETGRTGYRWNQSACRWERVPPPPPPRPVPPPVLGPPAKFTKNGIEFRTSNLRTGIANLFWSRVPGAKSYQIEIQKYRSGDNSYVPVMTTTALVNQIQISTLSHGSYRWTVKSVNSNGVPSSGGSWYTFTIKYYVFG
jgi:hypothetical protein